MARSVRSKGKITPPTRPTWSGSIRMSLVTIPVNIFNAIEKEGDVSFNMIHRPSRQRVRYVKTVPGVGEIENADIVKGFEVEKGQYIIVEPEELKALKIETSDSFKITQFVDREDIEPLYYTSPYYVAPSDEGAIEGFAVIRDALRATNKVGLGQIVLSGRERLASIQPFGDGMLLETLRYVDDLKQARVFFDPVREAKADKDQIDLAKKLIEQKVAAFQPDIFEDHYETAVREMIEQKRKGKKLVIPDEPARPSAEIIDIMEALKRSLGDAQPIRAGAAKKPAAANDEPTMKRKAGAGGRAKRSA